jgi:NAD(P)-dependent dehydrogenase (short-subunit alcohol dehydrogenase family)
MPTNRKVVLVGGASHGIGAACVEVFNAAGWRVAAVARTQTQSSSDTFLGLQVDLRAPGETRRAVTSVLDYWGRIDAVIHTAGTINEPLPVASLGWERWRQTLDTCLQTAVNLVEATFIAIKISHGAYVFVSSVGSHKVYPGIADYCAAKAALTQYSRSIAAELASDGARANSISPAVVDTRLLAAAPFSREQAAEWHALGRVGTPEEVAQMALFLSADHATWITGTDIVMDGGMSVKT